MAQDLLLEITEGRNRAKQLPLEYGSFGSSPNAKTVLDEAGIQRFHFLICCDSNGVAIIDEWKAGVQVNGSSIQKSLLKSGDEIQIGECKLRVRGRTSIVQSVQLPQSTPTQAPIPGTITERSADAEYFWFKRGGVKMGPVLVQTLRRLLAARVLRVNDVVCADGTAVWLPLPQAFTPRANSESFIPPPIPTSRAASRAVAAHQQPRDSQPPTAIAAARQPMPRWKKVVIGAVVVTILWPVVGLTVLYGYMKIKGKTHIKAESGNQDFQTPSSPDSDAITFQQYYDQHCGELDADEVVNAIEWLHKKHLSNLEMRVFPDEAEEFRSLFHH